MTFSATHQYRGMPLRYEYAYDIINGVRTRWYATEDGSSVCLPDTYVTEIEKKPQQGEVWKHNAPGDDFPLMLINEVGNFISHTGTVFGSHMINHCTKILNADGSPA